MEVEENDVTTKMAYFAIFQRKIQASREWFILRNIPLSHFFISNHAPLKDVKIDVVMAPLSS